MFKHTEHRHFGHRFIVGMDLNAEATNIAQT